MNSRLAHLSHPKHRPDIDGLRGVAVLSVVIFHAFPEWLSGGFIGVDIFFVISGYLISSIIFENLKQGSFSFLEFYKRRVRRIFPALLLILGACFFFGRFALFTDEFQQVGKHIAGGAAFVSNFLLWSESGYFDNASETKPLLHLWSLGIEEQFYLAWPLMVWFAWHKNISWFKLTLVALGASLLANVIGISTDTVATFYSPLTRFWELLSGSLLAWHALQQKTALSTPSAYNSNMFAVLGLTLIIAGIFGMTNKMPFPGWWALVPTTGTLCLLYSTPYAWINRSLLSNRIMVWFGLISFPLYLWHWPILSFTSIIKGQDLNRDTRLIAVSLALILSWLSYKFIENPIRSRGGNRSVVALLLACLVTFFAGNYAYFFGNYHLTEHSSVFPFTEKVREQFVGDKWGYQKNALCLQQYPMQDASSYAWWFCMKSQSKAPTLLLLGNSYANQLYPGFALNKRLAHHSILSIGTCDVGTAPSTSSTDKKAPCNGENFANQMDYIDGIVKESKTIKYVIIDGLKIDPESEYIDRVQKQIAILEKAGSQVIVFTPHIRPGFDVKSCFTRPLQTASRDCSFPESDVEKMKSQFQLFKTTIARSNPHVLFFNQNEMYCNDSKCSYISNELPLYRDKAHLSEYGSIKLQDFFIPWAEKNVPGLLLP